MDGGAGPQCKQPRGMAVDLETGRTYLADRGNDRVMAFDEAGAFLFSFGEGVLSDPTAVAVDNDTSSASRHDVYVADLGNGRIVKFDDEGNELLVIGEGEYEVSGPQRSENMLVGTSPGSDQLYVVDVRRAGKDEPDDQKLLVIRLRRYEPGGGAPVFEKDIVSGERLFGQAGGNLRGIAVDSAGALYVRAAVPVPAGEGLCKYDAEGDKVAGFRGAGCFPAREAEDVWALAVDAEDNLYAWGIDRDKGGSRYRVIAQYTPAGAPLRRFGYFFNNDVAQGLAIRPDTPPGPGTPVYASVGEEARIVPVPDPGPLAVGPDRDGVTSFKASVRAEVNPEGKATSYRFDYVPAAICEEDEAELGPGHCFDNAKSSATEALEIEGDTPAEQEEELYRINRAEAQIGCPDPESEAGLPESPCLVAETEYRWRIVATNEDGEAVLEGEPFETPEPLRIEDLWPTAVGTDTAAVHATVNPLGVPATGFFEYVTEAQFQAGGFTGARRVPASGELEFGAGEAGVTRSATLFPLQEGTAYRFRIVATNPLLEEPRQSEDAFVTFAPSRQIGCASEGLRGGISGARLGPAAFLSDCRAYELVTPLDKNNADVLYPYISNNRPARLEQSSADGGRLAYNSKDAFAEPAGAPWSSQYIAARRGDLNGNGVLEEDEGWQSHSISSPRKRLLVSVLKQADTEFQAFSADLCEGWLRSFADPPLTDEGIEGNLNLYRRSDGDGECGGTGGYEAITTIKPPREDPQLNFLELQGVAATTDRAIYSIDDTLPGTVPQAPAQPAECTPINFGKCLQRLYSHSAAEGTRYLCVLPGGAAVEAGCGAGTFSNSGSYHRSSNVENAISADGSRVFWSTPSPGEGQIYMRDSQGTTAPGDDTSIAVSAGGEALSGTSKSRFRCASRDGRVAVFSSGSELYAFFPDEGAAGLTHEIAGGLVGVLGCAQDAAGIYFATGEELAGAGVDAVNSQGSEAVPGEPNLYRYEAAGEAGEAGGYAFIGTLASADATGAGPLAAAPIDRLSRVTPSGAAAAFMSRASLTGFDATDALNGKADMELFVYRAGSDSLLCASCNPSGARPVGANSNRFFEGTAAPWAAAWIPGWESSLYAPQALSESGRRLLFESADRLVARDTNGRTDVYQWEAPGEGGCEASSPSYVAQNGGCVDLISSGLGELDAELRDASPSGEDVFFSTGVSLVPQDYGLVDIYDARAGGGLPLPPSPPTICEGEACQSPPPAPEEPTPASEAYSGPGNPVAATGCRSAAKRAKRAAGNAKALRRGARRLARRGARAPATRKARRARALAKRARALSRSAKRCRRQARAARRAGR